MLLPTYLLNIIVEYTMESGKSREREERAEVYIGLHCIESHNNMNTEASIIERL
jgi:hypothetical protein